MQSGPRLIWFPAPRTSRLFPCARASGRPCRPPGPYVPGFILPECVASSELLHVHVRPTPFGVRHTTRVLALIAISPARVHSLPRGFQPSLRSVHRRSQPHDGFLRASAPRLISSSNRVQGTLPSRGFSLRAAFPPSSGGGAPLPLGRPALTEPCGPAATTDDLDFEALLHAEKRSRGPSG